MSLAAVDNPNQILSHTQAASFMAHALQPGFMVFHGNRLEDLRDLTVGLILNHPLPPLVPLSLVCVPLCVPICPFPHGVTSPVPLCPCLGWVPSCLLLGPPFVPSGPCALVFVPPLLCSLPRRLLAPMFSADPPRCGTPACFRSSRPSCVLCALDVSFVKCWFLLLLL